MENCIFCKIASKEIPSKTAYEDEEVYAFHDLHPQAPIHVLLIPKRHIGNLLAAEESDSTLLGHMMSAAANVAHTLGIADGGFRVVTNIGPDGGQTVDHLHLHILGGRHMTWPPG